MNHIDKLLGKIKDQPYTKDGSVKVIEVADASRKQTIDLMIDYNAYVPATKIICRLLEFDAKIKFAAKCIEIMSVEFQTTPETKDLINKMNELIELGHIDMSGLNKLNNFSMVVDQFANNSRSEFFNSKEEKPIAVKIFNKHMREELKTTLTDKDALSIKYLFRKYLFSVAISSMRCLYPAAKTGASISLLGANEGDILRMAVIDSTESSEEISSIAMGVLEENKELALACINYGVRLIEEQDNKNISNPNRTVH